MEGMITEAGARGGVDLSLVSVDSTVAQASGRRRRIASDPWFGVGGVELGRATAALGAQVDLAGGAAARAAEALTLLSASANRLAGLCHEVSSWCSAALSPLDTLRVAGGHHCSGAAGRQLVHGVGPVD